MLVLLTLAAAYLACWWPTKEQGVDDVANHIRTGHGFVWPEESAPLVPLVVRVTERGPVAPPSGPLSSNGVLLQSTRCYYFWFFGFIAKLPYERELP